MLLSGLGDYEIFTFSIGDIDYSYDFQYYQGGTLRRSVVWEDPHIDGGRMKQEYGERLECEAINPVYESSSFIHEIWSLARSLGIETDYSKLEFRAYGIPKPTTGIREWLTSKIRG